MLTELLGNPLTPLSVILIVIVLIFTGRLVPWWLIQELRAENKHLRETVDTLTNAVDDFSDAARAQTQTSEIVKTVMKALQKDSSDSHGSGS